MTATYDVIPKMEESLQVYEPDSRTIYTIEAAARLAGVRRHAILVYCKRGLVRPVARPEGMGYCFDREGIRALRRIGQLRNIVGLNMAGIKMILELMNEVERLQGEVRSLRDQPTRTKEENEYDRTHHS